MRDLAEAVRGCVEEALCAAPLAGPEELFRQEVLLAGQNVLGMMQKGIDTDVVELRRLYARTDLDAPTDERPLSPEDRKSLRGLCLSYVKLSRHPLSPFAKVNPL